MKHSVVTALLLVAALACYGFGLGGDIAPLLALGAVFELGFWARAVPGFGMLSRKRGSGPSASDASTGWPGRSGIWLLTGNPCHRSTPMPMRSAQ